MDCFMDHQLQELLSSQKNEKSSETPGNVPKKDFQDMLHSLIKRIPSYNRRKKKSGDEYKNADNETAEQQQLKKRIEDCEKWFYSILYPKSPDMCINLAPIIIFILVDSYPFFKKNVKGNKGKPQFDLY